MVPIIFINCKKYPFVKQILHGEKEYETRNRCTLHRFIGERVYLAETGKRRYPYVIGSAIIDEGIEDFKGDWWESHRNKLCIPAGSEYDWNDNTKKKVAYHLTDVRYVAPFVVTPLFKRHGRIWAEYGKEVK